MKRIEEFFAGLSAKKGFFPLLLAILMTFALLPLLMPGLVLGHDLLFHLARLKGLAGGLSSGYPVYVNPEALSSYGYATGLFYPDIFLVPFAWLHRCGLSIVSSYKVFIIVWSFFNVYTMYFVVKRITSSSHAAFTGGVLYAFSSYMACDIFIRAATGEFLAFPFFVLAVYGAYELIYGDPRKCASLTFGLAGIVLTHNISLVLTGIVFVIWFSFNIRSFLIAPVRIIWTLLAVCGALMLSAFYWMPFLEQLSSQSFYMTSVTLSSPVAERAVPFTRLFLELPYMKTEFWHPAGIGIVFLVLFGLRMALRSSWTQGERVRDTFWILGFGCLICATNFLPWEGAFSKLGMIQFPWRFYLPALVFLALAGALTVRTWLEAHREVTFKWTFIILAFCAFAWFLNVGYVYAAKIHEKNIVRTFSSEDAGRLAASGLHYLPSSARLESILARGDKVDAPDGFEYELIRGNECSVLKMKSLPECGKDGFVVTLPFVWYEGYLVEIGETGRSYVDFPSESGLISFRVSPSDKPCDLRIYYCGTFIQKCSCVLSVLALIFYVSWIGVSMYIKSRKRV